MAHVTVGTRGDVAVVMEVTEVMGLAQATVEVEVDTVEEVTAAEEVVAGIVEEEVILEEDLAAVATAVAEEEVVVVVIVVEVVEDAADCKPSSDCDFQLHKHGTHTYTQ